MKAFTCLIGIFAAFVANAEGKPRDVATAVFGDEVALKQFLSAEVVTAQRLHLKPQDSLGTRTIDPATLSQPQLEALLNAIDAPHLPYEYSLGSYTRDPEVVLSRAQVGALDALFTNEASYLWTHDVSNDTPVMMKMCLPEYGVVFTCKSRNQSVQVALCMKCGVFGVFVGVGNQARRVNKEEDLDFMKPGLSKLLKELFPHDNDITTFYPKRPNQAMQPTARRSEAVSQFMKTPLLQATPALAIGG